MKFHIVTATYESPKWIRGCLDSIANQSHRDFSVCVVDDCSPSEDSRNIIKEVCEREGENWHYIFNEEKKTTLYNQVMGIRHLDPSPEDVIVFLDGDDRLAHKDVLSHLVGYYRDGTLMTYGNYRSEPYSNTCNLPTRYPQDIIDSGEFRSFAARGGGLRYNHLRTIKGVLFHHLDDSDFQDEQGKWLETAGDAAVMIPCMELATPKIKMIDEVLCIYNSENPISDWRRDPRGVDKDHDSILSMKKKLPLYVG